ncbi:MAG: MBL fold metallo-hydrolase [Clostridia bacterium]|nr:MBL fold metallo-hydrolase [Clostridia bacterium]
MKSNIKITASIIMLAVVIFSLSYVAFASDDIKILINGEELASSHKALFIEGKAFVPMREVFEGLGAEVSWDEKKRTARCVYKESVISITPDDSKMIKNGSELTLEQGPVIIDGTIMVSLRAVADSLGCGVIWRGKDRIASISDKPLTKIHFLDCGQADSIFAQFPDGECMLVDAGEKNFGKTLADFIKNEGYNHIDHVVATHPHSDHIGGMEYIINNFSIGKFYTSDVINDTKTFEGMINSLNKKGCKVELLYQGDEIPVSSCDVKVLSPEKRRYLRMNNYSVVLRLLYNKVSTMLCADAEAEAEYEIIDNEKSINSDVMKIGHHGSFTSTSVAFLNAVEPKDAVISVGEGNDYGYPSTMIINRLKNKGIKIHRTDKKGNITMATDGYIYIIVGEK